MGTQHKAELCRC